MWLVVTSFTMLVLPAVAGETFFWSWAIWRNIWSGTLSTSPSPKSEVLFRCATIVASWGTDSPTKSQEPTGPIPWDWISDPPRWVSGSNTLLVIVPNRVSTMSLSPPTAGFEWQAAHDVPLKTGPRPSATVSTCVNSTSPSLNWISWSVVRSGKGSPNDSGLSAAARHAKIPTSPNTITVADALNFICPSSLARAA